MQSIGLEILDVVETVNAAVALPIVRRAYIPEPRISADKDAEFGLIELEDGAVGLFYAWLGDSQRGISRRYSARDFVGTAAIEVARYFAREDDMARSLGLAAINAITQSVFRRAGFVPPDAANSMAGFVLKHGDHLGMIGNFPALVRRAQAQGIPVTVVERKRHMLSDAGGSVRITLDPRELAACNRIICTAATLINATIDEMVGYCANAETLAMVGPSASCFPDPLFSRGIGVLGGTTVVSGDQAVAAMRRGQGLRDCARRYTLTPESYPGVSSLISTIQEAG